jgi:STE24 endopeptidase
MFNRFEPLRGALEARLRRLASRYGAGRAEILRMDMSRQTRKANAFVTGVLGTQRIVVGDTLLGTFSEDEIEFVVAHELGHYVSKDPWRLIAAGQVLATLLFVIAQATLLPRERKQLRERALLLARLYLRMLVATQLLRPALLAFARSREWAADRFARKATNAPRTGAAAFARLREQNLAEDDVPGWYELFFSSHPSLRARISALQSDS